MLTVIIAEKHIIEQYEENKMLLSPFDSKEIVFCRWNCEGGSIDEMLPDLKNIISFNANWRAVIVTENNKDKINPFDYVQYSDYIKKRNKQKFDEEFIESCKRMFACYELSTQNPLTRLSAALCETPVFAEVIDTDLDGLLQSSGSLLQYIFKTQLEITNVKKLAIEIKKYRLEQLSLFVDQNRISEFLEALAQKDYSVIFELLPEEKLISFLEFVKIGNDAIYDPGYWSALLENTKKAEICEQLKKEYKLKNLLPQEVLYLALRTYDTYLHNSKVVWDERNEMAYTDFVRYNLYNEDIRFLIYDKPHEEWGNTEAEILKFHMLLQILAMHGNAAFSVTKNKVFLVDIEYDKKEFNRAIARLIERQKATALQIREEIYALQSKEIPQLDNRTARLVFECDIKIPVETDKEYDSSNLMAECKIGLSRDCPRDELGYWAEQYYNIRKLFKSFLREPRRAVKKACLVDFRENNEISDIRAIGLNENQKEDILIKLEEEEQSMVSTVTSAIYDTSKYHEAIDEADKHIRRGIEQRMTRKKTIWCSLFAILVYLIGFLPLIFSNTNTEKSFVFSLIITGIAIAVFAVCGFIYLVVLRKKMVARFENFNNVMRGICSDIKRSLATFSEYFSHACMVMREDSVLKLAECKETEDVSNIRILKYNLLKLEREIEKNHKILLHFSDESVDSLLEPWEKERIMPFDYNYMRQGEFEYPVFENYESKEIDYMQKGYKVEIPMSCVNEVTLKREELYD